MNGWLILDKPLGLSSTQALSKVKRLLGVKKAGHAGTLDPLASGILPLAFGEATKTIPFVQDANKEYEFTIAFGTATDTEDTEGAVIASSDERPTEAQIQSALPQFTGPISQIPPRYAAIKIDGARAYDLARQGVKFEMKSRDVQIHNLSLLGMPDVNHATLRVHCGKGTYIRSLARDIAAAAGTVGHVSYLKRTKVGHFGLGSAISLDILAGLDYETRAKAVLPFATALDDIPALAVNLTEAQKLRQGQAVVTTENLSAPLFKAIFDGDVIGLVEPRSQFIHPVRIFNL